MCTTIAMILALMASTPSLHVLEQFKDDSLVSQLIQQDLKNTEILVVTADGEDTYLISIFKNGCALGQGVMDKDMWENLRGR